MIKYDNSTINDWNFDNSNITKVYRNNAVVYQKVITGDTPTPPTGYTFVDYIERTATYNGYFGLGEYFTPDCKIEIQFQMTHSKGFSIIGDDFTSDRTDWRLFINYDISVNNLLSYDFINNQRKQYNTGNWAKLFHFEIGNYYVNDLDSGTTIITATPVSNFTRPCQMYLFHLENVPSQPNTDYGKVYFVKIWKNNVLVKDYVPFVDGDGVYGMYDNVANEAHYPTGQMTGATP